MTAATLDLPAGVAEQLRWEKCGCVQTAVDAYESCGQCGEQGRVLVLPQVVVAQEELTVPCPACSTIEPELVAEFGCIRCGWKHLGDYERGIGEWSDAMRGRVPFSEGTVRLTTECSTNKHKGWASQDGGCKVCSDRGVLTLADCVGGKQYDRDKVGRLAQPTVDHPVFDQWHDLLVLRDDVFDALPPGPKVLLIQEATT